ncbi:MAG: hypothetical protein IPK52_19320 [Chloroflexi bacterium]|nr:hypothetical protein [Chloroflexota bacterium]
MRRLLLTAFLLGIPALAQTATPVPAPLAPLGNGYALLLPEGWEVAGADFTPAYALSEGVEATLLVNGAVTLVLLTPEQVDQAAPLAAELDLPHALAEVNRAVYGYDIGSTGVEEGTLGDFRAALWVYDSEAVELALRGVTLIFLSADAGGLVFADAYGPVADFEALRGEIDAIALSMQRDAAAAVPSVTPAANLRPTPVPYSESGLCAASTRFERTVRMRVGPGDNRGPFAYLPANQMFSVSGQFPEGDGDIWLRLDKRQVPDSDAAEELWVKQSDVNLSGRCDALPTTEAPPVAPGNPQPTAIPTALPGPEIVPFSRLPEEGAWLLQLKPTYTVVCGTLPAFSGSVGDVSQELAENGLAGILSVNADGAVLTFSALGSDYVFTRSTPGIYSGPLQLGVLPTFATLTVLSTRLIDLQVHYTQEAGRATCTAIIGATLTK